MLHVRPAGRLRVLCFQAISHCSAARHDVHECFQGEEEEVAIATQSDPVLFPQSLSVFAALALVMLVLTFTWSIIVTNNFNKGLKQQLERARQRRRAEREGAGGTTPIKGVPWTDAKSTGHDDFEMGAKASRMSID
jgi:hypothetical protein